MATIEPGETLAELLARLEALEQRLVGSPGGAPARASAAGGAPAGAPKHLSATASGPRAAAFAPRASAPGAPARQADSAPPAPGRAPAEGAARTAAPERERRAGEALAPVATLTAEAAPGARAVNEGSVPAAPALDPAVAAGWLEVVAAINQKKRMLGAFLEECRFLGLGAGDLALATDDLHRAVVEEKENRALVVGEAGRVFGRPLELRLVPLAEAGLGPPQPADYRPLVDQAIAWFQGDPIERSAPRPERTTG